MPDDRLIHLSVGHSVKVNALTDFERLVWLMYKLASDDFGVMRFSSAPLIAGATFLEKRSPRAVLKALERVRQVELVRTFEHQGTDYLYQWDWQTWQKITHPRSTKQPKPPAELLAGCDANTRWLFTFHPKGGRLKSWQAHAENREDTGSSQGDDPDQTGPVVVSVGNGGVGVRDREGGTARLAFGGKVLTVPKFLDEEFVRRLNGQYFDVTGFYQALDQRLAQTGEAWDLRWIRDQFANEAPKPQRSAPEREITSEERLRAERHRRAMGGCVHNPRCETAAGCVALFVQTWRANERAVQAS